MMDGFVSIGYLYSEGSTLDYLRGLIEEMGASDRPIYLDERAASSNRVKYRVIFEAEEPSFSAILEATMPERDKPSRLFPRVPVIELRVDADEIRLWEPQERVETLLSLSVDLYAQLDPRPFYVYGLDMAHREAVVSMYEPPMAAAGLETIEFRDVSWLMLFPPAFVDEYGDDHIHAAPAWTVDDLDDGSTLLVGWSDPTDLDAYEPGMTRLREHCDVTLPDR